MNGMDNEPVVVRRDVQGLMVPSGFPVTLPTDALVYITQAISSVFRAPTPMHWARSP